MLLLLLAGAAAAAYTVAAGGASPRSAGGPIPRAAAQACAGPVTAVGRTEAINNARRLGHVLWMSLSWDGIGPTKT